MKNDQKVKYKPLSKQGTDRLYHIVFWPVAFFFSIFHPVRTIGREHIPEGAAVIAANHSAYADPMMAIMAFGYRNPLRIMAKEELFHIPVLGWLLIKLGMFGVNRGHSDISAIKRAIKVLKEGCKLMLFPEGTRVRRDEDRPEAKTGVVMFAHRTGAPLIPVYIPRRKHLFRPTSVIIGEAYYPDLPEKHATQEDYQRVADDLMERIYALRGDTECGK